jgi:hypothetical protein
MADDVTIQSFLYKFDDAEAAGFGGCAQNTAHSPESEAGIAFRTWECPQFATNNPTASTLDSPPQPHVCLRRQ